MRPRGDRPFSKASSLFKWSFLSFLKRTYKKKRKKKEPLKLAADECSTKTRRSGSLGSRFTDWSFPWLLPASLLGSSSDPFLQQRLPHHNCTVLQVLVQGERWFIPWDVCGLPTPPLWRNQQLMSWMDVPENGLDKKCTRMGKVPK